MLRIGRLDCADHMERAGERQHAKEAQRVLQVLRDANGEEVSMGATSSSSSSYRSATGPISGPHLGAARRKPCHRNAQQRDEYGFALHRLVSESAPAQITVPL